MWIFDLIFVWCHNKFMKRTLFAFNMSILIKLFIFLLSFFFFSSACQAFDFGLSSNIFNASPGSHQNLIIKNTSNGFLALEITTVTRVQDIDGRETNEEADDDFLIYPSQLLLNDGEEQVVNIRWLGTQQLSSEKAYRLVMEELPISKGQAISKRLDKSKTATLKILRQIMKSIYVRPAGAESDVVIESITPTSKREDVKSVAIVFYNRGTAHYILRDAKVIIEPKDSNLQNEKINLDDILTKTAPAVNILAKSRRRIIIDLPEKFKDIPVQVKIKY